MWDEDIYDDDYWCPEYYDEYFDEYGDEPELMEDFTDERK